ncbi:MAG: thioredoxin domain-containing protein [Actinomycetales bacterium]|nr:thioredoxin domain-containing protein [Actinomycetales bacterium]
MSESGKNRRDRAAAARDAAAADERRRERLVRIIGAVTVLVVVVGIIAVALVARNSSSTDATPAPTADPAAAAPAGTLPSDDPLKYGVPVGTAPADAPVLEIWEDFQCPACDAVEKTNGAGILDLANSGQVRLVWRMATFLDRVNEGGDPSVANSSTRAAAAFGCAIDAGKTEEFHKVVFDNQPANEGDGYTEEQLIAFGSDIGLTGGELDTYTQCVKDGTYLGWASNSGAAFQEAGHPGTPFALLNGVEVPTQTLVDQAALEALVKGGGSASSAPSPAAS